MDGCIEMESRLRSSAAGWTLRGLKPCLVSSWLSSRSWAELERQRKAGPLITIGLVGTKEPHSLHALPSSIFP
jgi:hypothetical protein